MLAAEGFTRT